MIEILAAPFGYLIGSIPFGLIIARLFGVSDIRKGGSGNIGATNVWRIAGPLPGFIVLLCDVGKGAAAVLLADSFSSGAISVEYLRLASGLAAIIGHIFPIFLRFRGGKGVNTALGVMITLLPIEALIALLVFVLTVAVSRYISLGSMLAAVAFALSIVAERALELSATHPIYVPISILLAVLIIFTHRGNIRRLLNRTESRFRFHSEKARGVQNHV